MLIVEYLAISLSIWGCSFMLISFLYFEQLRTTFGVISMWFAICGIGASLYPLLGDRPGDGTPLCIMQSLVGSYFVLVSLLATNILVKTIFRLFYPLDDWSATAKTKLNISWGNIWYAWGVPVVLVLLPLTTGSYGQDGDDLYCWIVTDDGRNNAGVLMEFLTFYSVIWLSILYNIILYVFIARRAYQMKSEGSEISQSISRTANKCKWYPIIAIFCWLMPTASRLGELFGWDSPLFFKLFGESIVYVQGFLDCLAFCYTSRVLTLWSLRIFGGAGNTTPSSKMFPFATDGENSDHFNSSDQESSENLLQPLNGSEGFYMDRGGLFSSIDEQLSDTRSSSKIFASESSSVFLGSQSSVQVGDLVSVYFEDSI